LSATIDATHLVKVYKKRKVVNNVTLNIKQGEIVGLLGPNGAGKTTSFYMIVGLIKANAGNIYINATEITQMPMYKRARLGIGYLAQESSVFQKMTVRDNLMAILETLPMTKSEMKAKQELLLEKLKITKVANQKAYTLSGGERRRTEIARALVIDPKFLLLDEPFAGVDPIAVQDIQRIVSELRDEMGIGVLITDHNVRETLKITDRSYIMFDGELKLSGTPDELVNNDDAKKFYLGDDFRL
jgi:lipopolysaccharide export system ATP-binding protein